MGQAVPQRKTVFRQKVMRDNIVPCPQNPIERAGCGDEVVASARRNDLGDELIDRRVLQANIVARAFFARRGRAPVMRLLVARRQCDAPVVDKNVVVEGAAAKFKLRGVNRADTRRDAQPFETACPGQCDLLVLRRQEQDFKGQLCAIGAAPLAVADGPARVLQQLVGAPEIDAVVAGPVGGRRQDGRSENLR